MRAVVLQKETENKYGSCWGFSRCKKPQTPKYLALRGKGFGRGLRAADWPYLTYPQSAAGDEGNVSRFAREAHRIRGPLHPTHFKTEA